MAAEQLERYCVAPAVFSYLFQVRCLGCSFLSIIALPFRPAFRQDAEPYYQSVPSSGIRRSPPLAFPFFKRPHIGDNPLGFLSLFLISIGHFHTNDQVVFLSPTDSTPPPLEPPLRSLGYLKIMRLTALFGYCVCPLGHGGLLATTSGLSVLRFVYPFPPKCHSKRVFPEKLESALIRCAHRFFLPEMFFSREGGRPPFPKP